jgi:hypothetical protein
MACTGGNLSLWSRIAVSPLLERIQSFRVVVVCSRASPKATRIMLCDPARNAPGTKDSGHQIAWS